MKTTWTSLLLVLPLTFAVATELKTNRAESSPALCAGDYHGTWNFDGGRRMSIRLDDSEVTLNYFGLETTLAATCESDSDGAVVNFSGSDHNGLLHSGTLFLAPEGATGTVNGYAFSERHP